MEQHSGVRPMSAELQAVASKKFAKLVVYMKPYITALLKLQETIIINLNDLESSGRLKSTGVEQHSGVRPMSAELQAVASENFTK